MEVRLPLDVVLFVLPGDFDVSASWNQVYDLWAPKVVVGDRESLVEGVNVTLWLQAPIQAHVQVIVKVFEILEVELLADQHLVDALHEVALEVAALEEGLCDGAADELEVPKMVSLHA